MIIEHKLSQNNKNDQKILCSIDYNLSYFNKLVTHSVFFQTVSISESKQMDVTTQKTERKTTSIEPGRLSSKWLFYTLQFFLNLGIISKEM